MSNRYGLAIRAADATDADGIAELMRAAEVPFAQQGLEKRLEAISTEPGIALLATEWGPPSGLVSVNWNWVLTSEAKVARVTVLVVDPLHRRKGIARLLLKAASQAARAAGCGDLRMNPPAGALHLRAFALATGFIDLGDAFSRPLRKRN